MFSSSFPFNSFTTVGKRMRKSIAGWAMDLSVPCIVEGRSELRNAGRVNCKIHWPFSGCGTPYLLNVFDTLQFPFLGIAVRLVECSLQSYRFRILFHTRCLIHRFGKSISLLFKRTLPYLAFKRSKAFLRALLRAANSNMLRKVSVFAFSSQRYFT